MTETPRCPSGERPTIPAPLTLGGMADREPDEAPAFQDDPLMGWWSNAWVVPPDQEEMFEKDDQPRPRS